MALMHPMYNHLGRSPKRKRRKTQSLLVAEKSHKKWLKSMGLDGKKPKRVNTTMLSVNYHTEQPIEKKKTFLRQESLVLILDLMWGDLKKSILQVGL